MLEILYDIGKKEVRGWCADENQFGNFKPTPEQEVVIWDIGIPYLETDVYYVDLDNQVIVSNPDYKPRPPLCTHWAMIDSFHPSEVKPMRVKRSWRGYEYQVNCYVTETIKDQYLAGDIKGGDFVLVEFLEDSADKAIVFAKVLKTW